MSDSIGSVRLDLETNAGPFQSQLNGIAGKSTNMVSAAFKGLGKVVAGAFAVSTLVNFGKEAINLASDLQEVQNVVDVVFGESANQINNFSKTAITQYGLSELAAKRYSSTMGAMLKSMGLSGDAVLGMSQSITALSGDMASFYNLNSDDAFNKIRAGISGETEPLKQLGINMSVANMEAFALSQGITKSYQSMTQAEQALLRYNYLLNTTADAQGDFARTSDSWANQTRILSEQWKSFSATLGSTFIVALTPVVKVLNWFISKLQIAAAYFKAFIEAITGIKAESNSASSGMEGIADSATEAGDAAVEAAKKASSALAGFDKLNVLSQGSDDSSKGSSSGSSIAIPEFDVSSLENVAIPEPDMSGVETVIGKVKGLFENLKSFVLESFAPTIQAWGGAFTSIQQPITDAVGSIKSSLQGMWEETIVPLGEYWLTDFVPSLVNSASQTLAPIFSDVLSFAVAEYATGFQFYCEQQKAWINDIILPALELLKKVFIDLFAGVKAEWDKSGPAILQGISDFFSSIRTIWLNLYNNVLKPVWDKILAGLSALWEEHLKPLWETLLSVCSKLVEAVLAVWNNALAPLINWIIDTFGPMFLDVFDIVWGAVKSVAGYLIDAVKNILEALGGLLDFITGVFTGDWGKAWEGIKTFFSNIWEAIVNIALAAWERIKLPFSVAGYFFGKVWEAIKGVFSPVGEWFSKIFTSAWEGIKTAWSAVKTWFSDLWSGIKGIFSAVGTWFSDLFKGAWQGIKDAWSAVTTWFSTLWGNIKGVFSVVGEWFSGIFDTAWKRVQKAWEGAKTWFTGIWDNIKGVFSSVGDWFKDKFTAAWTAVKNVFSTGGKIFDGIKDGILSGLKTVINGLIAGINKVIAVPFNGLNTALEKIRDISIMGLTPFSWISTISVPQIPQLARGGIIDQPTLAMVGEAGKEAVVPLENTAFADSIAQAILKALAPLFANGNSTGKNDSKTIVLKVGEYELGRVTVGAINKYHNVIGKVELEV